MGTLCRLGTLCRSPKRSIFRRSESSFPPEVPRNGSHAPASGRKDQAAPGTRTGIPGKLLMCPSPWEMGMELQTPQLWGSVLETPALPCQQQGRAVAVPGISAGSVLQGHSAPTCAMAPTSSCEKFSWMEQIPPRKWPGVSSPPLFPEGSC